MACSLSAEEKLAVDLYVVTGLKSTVIICGQ